ncbi:uncharacterized protein LOC131166367 [Malania oleifera]|uniref:uncharacterized protein LOC131166367 n=1 Tax=Malania oleifera TaxID=397392 RepID=UPI0025AE21DD|nr:uncharacterized protein LOC131166367 [Malania oleifera]XP_057980832.1 uncharacterized protein LOC131166367 [Malania oleifera]
MGWGISRLIGLKGTLMFFLFAYLTRLGFALLSVPFLYASLVSFLVSLASHPSINLPMLLGKKPDGTFPIWSVIMFSPYLYFVRAFSALRRFCSGEAPYSEICEGVYVGGWPYSSHGLPPGNPAIIDCTCEFPRGPHLSENAYLCVPTWDTRAPQPAEIESAVRWACRKRALKKPLFVHCAYGHGRSVAVMCALLVALGLADDWKNAEKLIRDKRPYIRMNVLHRKTLEEWSRHRLSSPKRNEEIDVSTVILSNTSGSSESIRSDDTVG